MHEEIKRLDKEATEAIEAARIAWATFEQAVKRGVSSFSDEVLRAGRDWIAKREAADRAIDAHSAAIDAARRAGK